MTDSVVDSCNIAATLEVWYQNNQRSFPWRTSNPDPWQVIVSEFLLQQTQTATIAPRFDEIIQAMPTPEACATLTDAHLRWLWDGLGYYRRAENLRKAARMIESTFQGQIPPDPEQLALLPGVGPYTTGAICAIAFDLAVPGVDGNIARVFSRFAGVKQNVEDAKDNAIPWLNDLYEHGSPRNLMQAVMDIGATICTAKSPTCSTCPLQEHCQATLWPDPTETPYKATRKAKQESQVVHAWIRDAETYYLEWRPEGLLGDRPAPLFIEGNVPPMTLEDKNGTATLSRQLLPYKHIFTHRVWHVIPAVYQWDANEPPSFSERADTRVAISEIRNIGLPKAFIKGLPDDRQESLPLC